MIASAQVGNICFTCCTGEADPSDDYEIDEACDKPPAQRKRKDYVELASAPGDPDSDGRDVSF
ncbi:hypothetical protein SBA3_2900010 [Candidatus Sulfopaludibacter sp. SbA3]|nr:hypothetical protein SBA3_2900010 [Candidatus Sulfopaludibacter sp. SbA3]